MAITIDVIPPSSAENVGQIIPTIAATIRVINREQTNTSKRTPKKDIKFVGGSAYSKTRIIFIQRFHFVP